MSLLLREAATAWGEVGLRNNDVVFEVITPASQLEVKVYPTQREFDRAAREFSNRNEFSWDAFIYFVDPAYKSDQSYIAAAKSWYHIHMFATLVLGRGLLITKLLPKSGHDKGDYRVDLAGEPLPEWDKLVANMSQRTKIAVERFRIHFVEWYLISHEP
jgi:hypothetical protein